MNTREKIIELSCEAWPPTKSLKREELVRLKRRAYGYLQSKKISRLLQEICWRCIHALNDRIAELRAKKRNAKS